MTKYAVFNHSLQLQNVEKFFDESNWHMNHKDLVESFVS